MELWMYLVVIGMFLVAIVGTVWITLWTIQRGERARADRGSGIGDRGAGAGGSTSGSEPPTADP